MFSENMYPVTARFRRKIELSIALLGSLLLFETKIPAAPPPSLNLDITHTVLQVYETGDGTGGEIQP